MITDANEDRVDGASRATTIDLAIRLGFVALVGYLSFRVISPFVRIGLWSSILAVALYPVFDWLAARMRPSLAAAIVTLLCLATVIGPVTWLGFGMVRGISALATGFDAEQLAVPPDSVKVWPLFGARLHQLWQLAATNMMQALTEVAPMIKPVGGKLLGMTQDVFAALFELLVAIVIAGFLFTRGPQLVNALSAFLDRMLSDRGKELVRVAGATVRSVSRGVIGIALLQAMLAGAGFLIAGIPAAGVLAFVALVLGIVQIGAGILILAVVVWSWWGMPTTHALIFTACMVPVGLLDNVLRPLVLGQGVGTPMPVIMIGVIGGTLAYGIVGLFVGPIVLAVAWAILVDWVENNDAPEEGARGK
jgi:predicted PurR-regulated permease PerM